MKKLVILALILTLITVTPAVFALDKVQIQAGDLQIIRKTLANLKYGQKPSVEQVAALFSGESRFKNSANVQVSIKNSKKVPSEVKQEIVEEVNSRYGVPKDAINVVFREGKSESPFIKSISVGVAQLNTQVYDTDTSKSPPQALTNREANIRQGTLHFTDAFNKCDGNFYCAIRVYNEGEKNLVYAKKAGQYNLYVQHAMDWYNSNLDSNTIRLLSNADAYHSEYSSEQGQALFASLFSIVGAPKKTQPTPGKLDNINVGSTVYYDGMAYAYEAPLGDQYVLVDIYDFFNNKYVRKQDSKLSTKIPEFYSNEDFKESINLNDLELYSVDNEGIVRTSKGYVIGRFVGDFKSAFLGNDIRVKSQPKSDRTEYDFEIIPRSKVPLSDYLKSKPEIITDETYGDVLEIYGQEVVYVTSTYVVPSKFSTDSTNFDFGDIYKTRTSNLYYLIKQGHRIPIYVQLLQADGKYYYVWTDINGETYKYAEGNILEIYDRISETYIPSSFDPRTNAPVTVVNKEEKENAIVAQANAQFNSEDETANLPQSPHQAPANAITTFPPIIDKEGKPRTFELRREDGVSNWFVDGRKATEQEVEIFNDFYEDLGYSTPSRAVESAQRSVTTPEEMDITSEAPEPPTPKSIVIHYNVRGRDYEGKIGEQGIKWQVAGQEPTANEISSLYEVLLNDLTLEQLSPDQTEPSQPMTTPAEKPTKNEVVYRLSDNDLRVISVKINDKEATYNQIATYTAPEKIGKDFSYTVGGFYAVDGKTYLVKSDRTPAIDVEYEDGYYIWTDPVNNGKYRVFVDTQSQNTQLQVFDTDSGSWMLSIYSPDFNIPITDVQRDETKPAIIAPPAPLPRSGSKYGWFKLKNGAWAYGNEQDLRNEIENSNADLDMKLNDEPPENIGQIEYLNYYDKLGNTPKWYSGRTHEPADKGASSDNVFRDISNFMTRAITDATYKVDSNGDVYTVDKDGNPGTTVIGKFTNKKDVDELGGKFVSVHINKNSDDIFSGYELEILDTFTQPVAHSPTAPKPPSDVDKAALDEFIKQQAEIDKAQAEAERALENTQVATPSTQSPSQKPITERITGVFKNPSEVVFEGISVQDIQNADKEKTKYRYVGKTADGKIIVEWDGNNNNIVDGYDLIDPTTKKITAVVKYSQLDQNFKIAAPILSEEELNILNSIATDSRDYNFYTNPKVTSIVEKANNAKLIDSNLAIISRNSHPQDKGTPEAEAKVKDAVENIADLIRTGKITEEEFKAMQEQVREIDIKLTNNPNFPEEFRARIITQSKQPPALASEVLTLRYNEETKAYIESYQGSAEDWKIDKQGNFVCSNDKGCSFSTDDGGINYLKGEKFAPPGGYYFGKESEATPLSQNIVALDKLSDLIPQVPVTPPTSREVEYQLSDNDLRVIGVKIGGKEASYSEVATYTAPEKKSNEFSYTVGGFYTADGKTYLVKSDSTPAIEVQSKDGYYTWTDPFNKVKYRVSYDTQTKKIGKLEALNDVIGEPQVWMQSIYSPDFSSAITEVNREEVKPEEPIRPTQYQTETERSLPLEGYERTVYPTGEIGYTKDDVTVYIFKDGSYGFSDNNEVGTITIFNKDGTIRASSQPAPAPPPATTPPATPLPNKAVFIEGNDIESTLVYINNEKANPVGTSGRNGIYQVGDKLYLVDPDKTYVELYPPDEILNTFVRADNLQPVEITPLSTGQTPTTTPPPTPPATKTEIQFIKASPNDYLAILKEGDKVSGLIITTRRVDENGKVVLYAVDESGIERTIAEGKLTDKIGDLNAEVRIAVETSASTPPSPISTAPISQELTNKNSNVIRSKVIEIGGNPNEWAMNEDGEIICIKTCKFVDPNGLELRDYEQGEILDVLPKNKNERMEYLQQEEKRLSQQTVATFIASIEKALTEFQGLGYLASLFMDQDALLAWRDRVDRIFATFYLGTEYITSSICSQYLDGQEEGIAYAETPQGLAQIAAHIEATKTEPIVENGTTQFIYKITFSVRNGDYEKDLRAPEEMKVNVVLKGQKTVNVFKKEQVIKRGSTLSRAGRNAIVQESPTSFDKICLTFDQVPLRWKISDKEICNKIQASSGTPTELKPEAKLSGTKSESDDINDF